MSNDETKDETKESTLIPASSIDLHILNECLMGARKTLRHGIRIKDEILIHDSISVIHETYGKWLDLLPIKSEDEEKAIIKGFNSFMFTRELISEEDYNELEKILNLSDPKLFLSLFFSKLLYINYNHFLSTYTFLHFSQ